MTDTLEILAHAERLKSTCTQLQAAIDDLTEWIEQKRKEREGRKFKYNDLPDEIKRQITVRGVDWHTEGGEVRFGDYLITYDAEKPTGSPPYTGKVKVFKDNNFVRLVRGNFQEFKSEVVNCYNDMIGIDF